ncbi:hypothetical protein IAT38_002637 [Cryptococcus sp. DSM 104549]
MSAIDITGMTTEQVETIASAAMGADKGVNMGPWIMALVFDCLMWGIISQQILTWWQFSRPTERPAIKYLVYFTAVNTTAYTCFGVYYALYNFVYNYGRYAVFIEVPIPGMLPVWDSVSSATVQAFYIERAFRLNGSNYFVLLPLCILICGQIGMSTFTCYSFLGYASLLQASLINPHVYAWLSISMSADVAITSLVAWGLYKARTGWSQTDKLVKSLILLALETQLAPTLCTLGFLIEFIINPPSSLGIFFEIITPKVYALGFLATLNSRYHLRKDMISSHAQAMDSAIKTNTYVRGGSKLQQATINVQTDTYVESFQMKPERKGLNRDPAYQLKSLDERDESVENLDYAQNLSKKNLHDDVERMV